MKIKKKKAAGENKKYYTIYLDKENAEKVKRVLSKANLPFSTFVSIQIDAFANLIDETGWSEKLENMSLSDALIVLGGIYKGIENEQKEIKKIEKKKSK